MFGINTLTSRDPEEIEVLIFRFFFSDNKVHCGRKKDIKRITNKKMLFIDLLSGLI